MGKTFEEIFKNPPAKYRGTPFWSWNGKLDTEKMKQQIDNFEKMGFGGFHIHSRIGLEDEYLGDTFLEKVKACHQYAAEKNMYTYLYDEDKWPSGCAGGRATQEVQYRARYLLFSPQYHKDGLYCRNEKQTNRLTKNGELTFLKAYKVTLNHGKLESYQAFDSRTAAEEGMEKENSMGKKSSIWYAYRMITDANPWFNNSAYLDTLNAKATEKFTEVGYEPYARLLGEEFSKTVPSIFTDEPQYTRMESMRSAESMEETGIPYTDNFEALFIGRYGKSLLEHLPEVFWDDCDGRVGPVRYDYMNLLCDQFAENYAGVLGKWCGEHHIMLTGHLMEESGLETQLRSAGEVMRSYAKFQMPGIDMLADGHEYTTVKQAQSVARQMGKTGVISELYGVTNWNYDFRGHKTQGDWQVALGVTVRVPHLSWMYMGGESKRDYPAPIDAHSPWYQKYHLIEDYFSRVNLFLEEGNPSVQVGVIHPIESMFMELGSLHETALKRQMLEEQFHSLTEWLLFGLIDFDFISEALLTELETEADCRVGKMQYRVIVVPELTTIRKTTLEFLERFAEHGGTVIVLGALPVYMDGRVSEEPSGWMERFERIGYDKYRLLEYLEDVRELDIRDEDNLRSEDLIYQMRKNGKKTRIFIAHGKNLQWEEMSVTAEKKVYSRYQIKIKGCYSVERYDAMTGEKAEQSYETDGENTCLNLEIYAQDSVLLELEEEGQKQKSSMRKNGQLSNIEKKKQQNREPECVYENYLPSVTDFRLEEENVLLLDMAEYAVDDGDWKEKEEILKLDDKVRESLGYRKRTDSFPQPWLTKEKNRKEHKVRLRFAIYSEIEAAEVKLAFEGDTDCRILWNGCEIENAETGEYYVDSSIQVIRLSKLRSGRNVLECIIPFGNLTNLECFYLLGDFGIHLCGDCAVITKLPERIGFGDYAVQGLPFYGGNLIYDVNMKLPGGRVLLTAEEYKGALLEVQIDEETPREIFLAPYTVECGEIEAGEHRIRIRCYGTRINTFGQLHNCNKSEIYFGPKTWRTKGKDWCYEYRLHPCGILKAPEIKIFR